MAGNIPTRWTLLLAGSIWLAGCIPVVHSGNEPADGGDDPFFAGYHRSGPSQGVTQTVIDRAELIRTTPAVILPPAPAPIEGEQALSVEEYNYQQWLRERNQAEGSIQINLLYHLNGPYYYHDFQTRYWYDYYRRWNRLPWYTGGWYFDDLWWDYPSWHYGYDWQARWYDPWGYDRRYYDPWDSYYDPWFYDPYWSHRPSYGYYSGYGRPYWRPRYSTYATVTDPARKTTTRRARNRSDLPVGRSGSLSPDQGSGESMTKTVATQPGQAKSSGSSSGAVTRRRQSDSGSRTAGTGSKARSFNRQGSRSPEKSTPTASRTNKTSSGSKSKSSSTKTARSRGRKP